VDLFRDEFSLLLTLKSKIAHFSGAVNALTEVLCAGRQALNDNMLSFNIISTAAMPTPLPGLSHSAPLSVTGAAACPYDSGRIAGIASIYGRPSRVSRATPQQVLPGNRRPWLSPYRQKGSVHRSPPLSCPIYR